jgi:DNA ligase 1
VVTNNLDFALRPVVCDQFRQDQGRITSMLLSRLAETRIGLTATRSRNTKRDLIAAVLRETSRDDVEVVVSYLSGSLRQRRTGVGWKSLQSTPPPAAEASLTVGEVDAVFEYVAGLSGA